jgi:glycosyltransferase involved in cell wall biosynthesis
LVPEYDAAALADTLEKLLQTDSVGASVAAAGREHARKTFDKRLMYPSYEKLFQALWVESI